MIRLGFRFLIALLLCALIWWIGPQFAIGIYRPFAGVLVREILITLVLAWGLWPILTRLWMRLAMSPRKVSAPKSSAPPDFIDQCLRELDRQLKTRWLREPRSRWQHWGGLLRREYRSALPWYLVLGTEGSGKTHLVASAANQVLDETQPAYAIDSAGQMGDDLAFRITGEAVWFDIGGRWNLRDGDDENLRASWQKLLRGLRRLHGGAPVNGVVLCVDSAMMLDASLETRKRLADAARRRIGEIHEIFGQRVQVYVALNGLDRLDGAISTLSLVDGGRWHDGVGFCLPEDPVEENAAAARAGWQHALDQLLQRVQHQVLYSAPSADEASTNFAQLRFVETLSRMHRSLLVWLQIMVAPGEPQCATRLRGVWMGSMAELGVSRAHAAPGGSAYEAPAQTRPLKQLWAPLFRQVALEHEVPQSSAARTLRGKLRLLLRNAALPLIALVLLLWSSWGYFQESDFLSTVAARFEEAKRIAQVQASYGTDGGSQLIEISNQMSYAQSQAVDAGRGLTTPYFEHGLVAAASMDTYHRHLQKMLLPELYNEVQRTLVAQMDGAPGDIYDTLKVYLMLTRPKHRDSAAVERWLDSRWDQLAGGQYGDDDRQTLLQHVHALLALPNLSAAPEDANLVLSARAKASQVPVVTRVLNDIRLQGLPSQVNDISLSRAAGFESTMVLRLRSGIASTDTAVSGWYTRAGYTDVFTPRLLKSARATLEEENWVLRDEAQQDNSLEFEAVAQKLADATRAQFLQDYIAAWRNFLKDVTVRSVTGLDDAAQLSAAMMDPQSSLAQLIRFAGRETTLTGISDEGNIDSWIDRQKYRFKSGERQIVGELNGQHYRTLLLPEHVVEEQFQALRQFAAQLNNRNPTANNPLTRLFEPLYRQLGLVNGALQAGQVLPAQYDAFARLKETAARQPDPIRSIMVDLIGSGTSMSTRETGALLNRGAAGAASMVCNTGFTERYPFRRNSQMDAGVDDFQRMFSAQGTMASYFHDHLAQFVDTSSTPWKALAANGGSSGMVSSSVMKSYETADRIRSVALDGSGRVLIPVSLRFLAMDSQISEAQLTIGDQTMGYAHGMTSPQRVDWTGQNSKLSLRLQMKSVDGRLESLQFDGPWALLRFFDAGQAGDGTADRRERVYQTSLGSVRLEWQALTTPSPIWSGILQSFRCPS
jgi:type VI secretion system protein ImpL